MLQTRMPFLKSAVSYRSFDHRPPSATAPASQSMNNSKVSRQFRRSILTPWDIPRRLRAGSVFPRAGRRNSSPGRGTWAASSVILVSITVGDASSQPGVWLAFEQVPPRGASLKLEATKEAFGLKHTRRKLVNSCCRVVST